MILFARKCVQTARFSRPNRRKQASAAPERHKAARGRVVEGAQGHVQLLRLRAVAAVLGAWDVLQPPPRSDQSPHDVVHSARPHCHLYSLWGVLMELAFSAGRGTEWDDGRATRAQSG